jgi:hypothetical protein
VKIHHANEVSEINIGLVAKSYSRVRHRYREKRDEPHYQFQNRKYKKKKL